jgi:hypothetical protein
MEVSLPYLQISNAGSPVTDQSESDARYLQPRYIWHPGCDHDVFILDDHFVFRFDTMEEAPLSLEVSFLQSIQGTLGVSVFGSFALTIIDSMM